MNDKTLADDLAGLMRAAGAHEGERVIGPAEPARSPIVIIQNGDANHVGLLIQQSDSGGDLREAPAAPMNAVEGEE